MTAPDLLVDRRGALVRAVLVQPGARAGEAAGRLVDIALDREGVRLRTGAVCRGRVVQIMSGLDAAFVDVGTAQAGLLSAKDVRPLRRNTPIGRLLRAGDTVLVQVKAEAHGRKGPTLSMDIALPGRFLVRAPFVDGVRVSRRIAGGGQGLLAKRVRAIVTGDGWIVRGGAEGAPDSLLAAEAEHLAVQWRDIAARTDAPPAVLDPGPPAPVRLLVEHGGRPLGRLYVDDPATEGILRGWCAAAAPDLADHIEAHRGRPGLFESADIEDEIDALAGKHVPLPGGGWLVVERTEALWVIDVNGAERQNAAAVNRDAAREIARQLRLRNIGGVVVVDFITPDRPDERERVLNALVDAVADDPVATHVYGMSKLGLVELTRVRRGPPLIDLLASADRPESPETSR
ncbi:MAG TPA: ribonuclease E/G [Azospirillaceae bacterium]|nr:ribonuclease E/G [Azospirillaceae bacterium]